MKKNILMIVVILLVIFAGVAGFKYYLDYSVSPSIYNDDETLAIKSNMIVSLDDDIWIPTGITYDEQNNSFWLCDYRNDDSPGIIFELSIEFQLTGNKIDLSLISDEKYDLQGIAYDPLDDALWIATGNKIIEIEKNGTILNEFDLNQFKIFKSNGISYDKDDDSIWVLCNQKQLININKDGTVKKTLKCNIKAQDHILYVSQTEILFTAGDDYNGVENFVMSIDSTNGHISAIYKLQDSFSVEGLTIVGGNLYIVNDGIYHNAQIKDNYVACYFLK